MLCDLFRSALSRCAVFAAAPGRRCIKLFLLSSAISAFLTAAALPADEPKAVQPEAAQEAVSGNAELIAKPAPVSAGGEAASPEKVATEKAAPEQSTEKKAKEPAVAAQEKPASSPREKFHNWFAGHLWKILAGAEAFALSVVGGTACYLLWNWRRVRFLQRERELFARFTKERQLLRLVTLPDREQVIVRPEEEGMLTFGYTKEELAQMTFLAMVVPEDKADVRAILDGVQARPKISSSAKIKCRLLTKRGATIPVEGVVCRQRRKGNIELVAVLEKVQWEDELLEAQARLDTLCAHGSDGILIIDEQRKILAANEEFCRRFKLTTAPIQLRGLALDELGADETSPARKLSALAGAPLSTQQLPLDDATTVRTDVVPLADKQRGFGRVFFFHDNPGTIKVDQTAPALDQTAPARTPPKPAVFGNTVPTEPWCPDEMQSHLPWLGEVNTTGHYGLEASAQLAGWRLVGATRRGRLHEHRGTYREDAFRWETGANFTIACVSDGAGSSHYSRIGSESTCRAVTRALREEFERSKAELDEADAATLTSRVAKAMGNSVWQACVFLHELAGKAQCEIKDFRCTFLLIVHYESPAGTILLGSQVGDGFVEALFRDGQTRRFGSADSGEFSGQVSCFIPEDEAVKKAATIFRIPHEELEALMLCSDGIEDPFFPIERRANAVFRQLALGVLERLPGFDDQKLHGPVLGAPADVAALETWLSFEKRGENDDRTLLALYRTPFRLDPQAIPLEPAP